jgi:hypothetical protein
MRREGETVSKLEQCKEMVQKAVRFLPEEKAHEILTVLNELVGLIYVDLRRAIVGNPLEHHFIVLGHMMEITAEEESSQIPVKRAAVLSLLHDIAPVDKITKHMIEKARERSLEEAEALEMCRQQNRVLHMREGSSMGQRKMLELNESLGRSILSADDMEAICEAIGIHDNPSLDMIIKRANWLAVAFREADRLWMVTDEGIRADLERKGILVTPDACLRQLESNVSRFKEERLLYRDVEAAEGPFHDAETFFRTKTGFNIFRRLYEAGILHYKKAEH